MRMAGAAATKELLLQSNRTQNERAVAAETARQRRARTAGNGAAVIVVARNGQAATNYSSARHVTRIAAGWRTRRRGLCDRRVTRQARAVNMRHAAQKQREMRFIKMQACATTYERVINRPHAQTRKRAGTRCMSAMPQVCGRCGPAAVGARKRRQV